MSRPSFGPLPQAVREVLAAIPIGGTFNWLTAKQVLFTPDSFPLHACMDLEEFYSGLQAAIDEAAPDFSIKVCADEEAVRFMEFGKTHGVMLFGTPVTPWQLMQAWRRHQQRASY